MKNINPIKTKSWKDLQTHFENIKNVSIRKLFHNDPKRFLSFSGNFNNQILIDFSKNHITKETIKKLINLANETHLKDAINAMLNGEKINYTENRSVLHTALRNCTGKPIYIDGKNIMLDINNVLNKMEKFCIKIINGNWKGYTEKKITDIVNIGIGGSNLGPYMVTEALKPYKNHLKIHFISNIDGTNFTETIKKINPQTTLFIIASKTFSTQETMTNASSARKWFLTYAKYEKYIKYHFVALSTNIEKVKDFGIDINNMFEFWDWVGGRYSLWSSVGLSIALSIGFNNFKMLLKGAHDMDQHFEQKPFKENLPVLLALIGIWYNNFFGTETEAILPYDQYLHKFAAYLQQTNMESNGKCIDRNGKHVEYQTGSIIWGEPGTNGQHAFYQLIHQGTKLIPCDFIAPVLTHNPVSNHHLKLIANFFAQTKALAFGKSKKTVEYELHKVKIKEENIKKIIPHKVFDGNRPSNSILLRKINPYNLGALIALYEHKIFTQGIILNIYSFDQWGVELGKQIADKIYTKLKNNKKTLFFDNSTNGLINVYKNWKIN